MKHLGSLKSTQEARVAHLSCPPNFLRASYLEERTLTYEPIVNQCALIKKLLNIVLEWIKSLDFFFKEKLQLWRSDTCFTRLKKLNKICLVWAFSLCLCSMVTLHQKKLHQLSTNWTQGHEIHSRWGVHWILAPK